MTKLGELLDIVERAEKVSRFAFAHRVEFFLFLFFVSILRHNEAHKRLAAAFFEPDFQKHIKDYFTNTTQAMLKKHVLAFHNSSRRQIDVVRDVCNVVPTLWVANKVGIPIKSEETPHGLMSHAELRLSLLVLFIWFSFDGELDLGCIDIEMKMESRT